MKKEKINFICRVTKLKVNLEKSIMKIRFYQYILGFIFVILFFPVAGDAESARSLIEKGNEAFGQGDYSASLEHYNKAAEMEPDSAIVLFNRGDALYRQEKYAEALNVFEQAAAKALQNNDRMLEAQSRYNMGNSSFHEAEKLRQENLEMSLAEYKRSSQYYQSAAKLDPDFTDAAYNLEASRIAVKQVEELMRKQRQEAQQNEQLKQNIAKELENLQKEQQDAAEQSSESDQSRQQEGSENKETGQSEQLAENQKSITDRTREAGQKLEKMSQDKDAELSNEMAREHVKKAVEKQEEAEKELQQNKLSEAHENQQEASRELQKALQQLAQNQDQEQNKDKSGRQEEGAAEKQKAEQQEQNEQQTLADEAGQQEEQSPAVSENYGDVSPEDIINEEIENKKYRSVRGKTGYDPVDKDW